MGEWIIQAVLEYLSVHSESQDLNPENGQHNKALWGPVSGTQGWKDLVPEEEEPVAGKGGRRPLILSLKNILVCVKRETHVREPRRGLPCLCEAQHPIAPHSFSDPRLHRPSSLPQPALPAPGSEDTLD